MSFHEKLSQIADQAVRRVDLAIMEILHLLGVDFNRYTYDIWKYAIQNNRIQMVYWLQQHREIIRPNYDRGLFLASKMNHFLMVQELVTAGADIQADDNAALLCAVRNRNLAMVCYLAAHGADVRAQQDTALMIAVENNQLEMAKMLLWYGGTDAKQYPSLVLNCAIRHNYHQMLKLLIEAGVNVSSGVNAAITQACHEGHAEIIKMLTPHIQDFHLREIIRCGYLEILQNLHNVNRYAPSHYDNFLSDFVESDSVAILKFYLELCYPCPKFYIKVDAKGRAKRRQIYDAECQKSMLDILDLACQTGKVQIVTWLFDVGLDVNQHGYAAMTRAIESCQHKVVSKLIEIGVNVEWVKHIFWQSRNYKYPFLLAIESADPLMLNILWHAGCSYTHHWMVRDVIRIRQNDKISVEFYDYFIQAKAWLQSNKSFLQQAAALIYTQHYALPAADTIPEDVMRVLHATLCLEIN